MCAKIKKMNPEMEPNMTLELNNDKLEEMMTRYASEKTAACLNELLNVIRDCRVLMPANVNDEKKPIPCFIKNQKEEMFLPIYTSKGQIPTEPKSPAIMNVPYLAVNQMAANPQMKASGIVINPFTNNLVFKMELIQKIDEVEKLRAQGKQLKQVKLSPEQYVKVEKKQFERVFLTRKFFQEGQAFMDVLCERKEEYIDELFEESYQQKRMYPYLPEEFSVMIMNLSEDMQLVRVDMPNRDMEKDSCYRVYMYWNRSENCGRYFMIAKAEHGSELVENVADGTVKNHGPAPVEGAELQTIIDLIQNKNQMTS